MYSEFFPPNNSDIFFGFFPKEFFLWKKFNSKEGFRSELFAYRVGAFTISHTKCQKIDLLEPLWFFFVWMAAEAFWSHSTSAYVTGWNLLEKPNQEIIFSDIFFQNVRLTCVQIIRRIERRSILFGRNERGFFSLSKITVLSIKVPQNKNSKNHTYITS
jgi:hypothetical protein